MTTLKVAIVLVTHDVAIKPFTPDEARAAFAKAAAFIAEFAYGQVQLVADVFGWFVRAIDPAVLNGCPSSEYRDRGELAAAGAGIDLAQYDKVIHGFPNNGNCHWPGWTTAQRIYMNGGNMTFVGCLVHELGHTFGLNHARHLDCGPARLSATGRPVEYGDLYDIMGGSGNEGYPPCAPLKERAGWLNKPGFPPITTVTQSGVYEIEAYDTLGTGPKALKIPVALSLYPQVASSGAYYVEARRGPRYDNIWKPNVREGVLIHLHSPSTSSLLLHMNAARDWIPGVYSKEAPALEVGMPAFVDPVAKVSIRLLAWSPTGATVEVTRDAIAPPVVIPPVVIPPIVIPPVPGATTWTQIAGALRLNGTLLTTAPQPGIVLAVVAGMSGATQSASADFTSVDNNLGPRFGIVLRYQNQNNYYIAYRQTGGSSQLRIAKVVNGGETVLAAVGIGNPAKGAAFKLAASATGGVLVLSFNGVSKLAVAHETTFATGGVGIVMGCAKGTAAHLAADYTASVT